MPRAFEVPRFADRSWQPCLAGLTHPHTGLQRPSPSLPVYEGFGPTLAAEYLAKKHGIEASRETVRQWMI